MSKKEQELKLLLTKETYDKLLAHAEAEAPVLRQTNYYFDMSDFHMGKNGVMLRVREENSRWIVCAKIKQKSESAAVSSIELEQEIPPDVFKAGRQDPEILVKLLPEEGQAAIRRLVNPSDLVIRGTLRNERRKLQLIEGYTCELDRTLLPENKEQYELEIEGMENEAACRHVIETLSSMGYSFSVNQKSKYQRLQEAMGRLNS
jgi:uncharacterized protein YjbK